MSTKPIIQHKTENTWTIYYHHPDSSDWSMASYKIIAKIATIEQFWTVLTELGSHVIENGMLFIMRGDIPPLWEHYNNAKGGSYSIRIGMKNVEEIFNKYSASIIGECLLPSESEDIINGISISPKRGEHCIIKIWNQDAKKKNEVAIPRLHPDISIIHYSLNVDKRM